MAEICIAASSGLHRRRRRPRPRSESLPQELCLDSDRDDDGHQGPDHDSKRTHNHQISRQRHRSAGQSQLSRGARGACTRGVSVSGPIAAGPSAGTPSVRGGRDDDNDEGDNGQGIDKGRRRVLRAVAALERCRSRHDEEEKPLSPLTLTNPSTSTTTLGKGDPLPSTTNFCEALEKQLSALISPYRCLTLQRRCLCSTSHHVNDTTRDPDIFGQIHDNFRLYRRKTSPEQRLSIIRERWKRQQQQQRLRPADDTAMNGAPPGWEADYDGRRWFYRYKPTGHIQYRFPGAGDEFPDYVDALAPPPDLAPEERHESRQQVRRQMAGRLYGDPAAALPRPRMVATVERPVSLVWRADGGDERDDARIHRGDEASAWHAIALRRQEAARKADRCATEYAAAVSPESTGVVSPSFISHDVVKNANAKPTRRPPVPPALSLSHGVNRKHEYEMAFELPVNVSPKRPAFDPVGVVAEMPTDYTQATRFGVHSEPVEMAGSSVPAPIETNVPIILAELPGKTSPLQRKPPVVIGPSRWSEAQKQAEQTELLSVQKQTDQKHTYHPYVPGVVFNTQASTDRQRNRTSSLQREASLLMGVNSGTPASESNEVVQPAQAVTRKPLQSSSISSASQVPGTLPAILQPAGGRTPFPPAVHEHMLTAREKTPNVQDISKKIASVTRISEPAPTDVSPLQSRSGSLSSGNVVRTPSPPGTSRSSSLNASLAQQMNNGANSLSGLNETLSSILGGGPLHNAKYPGPAVPKKIPLEPSDFGSPKAPTPGWTHKIYNQRTEQSVKPREISGATRYPATEYPIGFQVKSDKIPYRAFAPSDAVAIPGAWPTHEKFHDQDLDMPHWPPPPEAGSQERPQSRNRDEKQDIVAGSGDTPGTPRNRATSIKRSSLEFSPAAQKAILHALTPSPSSSFRRRNSGGSVKRDTPQQTPLQPAVARVPEQVRESSNEVKSELKPSVETPTPLSLQQLKKQTMPNPLGSYPVHLSQPHVPTSVSMPAVNDAIIQEKEKKWNKWFKGAKSSKEDKARSESTSRETEESTGLGIMNQKVNSPPVSLRNQQPGRKQNQHAEFPVISRPRTGYAGTSPSAGAVRASGALPVQGPPRTHGRSVSDSTGAYTTAPGPKAPRAPSQLPRRSALPRLVNTPKPTAMQSSKGMPVLVITSPTVGSRDEK